MLTLPLSQHRCYRPAAIVVQTYQGASLVDFRPDTGRAYTRRPSLRRRIAEGHPAHGRAVVAYRVRSPR